MKINYLLRFSLPDLSFTTRKTVNVRILKHILLNHYNMFVITITKEYRIKNIEEKYDSTNNI